MTVPIPSSKRSGLIKARMQRSMALKERQKTQKLTRQLVLIGMSNCERRMMSFKMISLRQRKRIRNSKINSKKNKKRVIQGKEQANCFPVIHSITKQIHQIEAVISSELIKNGKLFILLKVMIQPCLSVKYLKWMLH